MKTIDDYDGTNFERVSIQLLSNIQELLQTKMVDEKQLKIESQLAVMIKLSEIIINKEAQKNEK